MKALDPETTALEGEHLARHIEQALAAQPPDDLLQAALTALVRRVYRPVLIDTDNIPDQPCLFIGNHSLFAFDGMVLLPTMQAELGRFLRPLGDKFLFTLDASRRLLTSRGGVIGHPQVCDALMEAGQDLLVFPGGAHEAVKRADQKYALQWKDRTGFVRLAARHGYTIVPFAMVGPDEFYDHLVEGSELLQTPLLRWLQRSGLVPQDLREDMLPPIPLGALGTLLPKPQRCFIQYGEPVDLSSLAGSTPGKPKQRRIRDQVSGSIEAMLPELLLQREQRRREEGLLRRLLTC